jgi:transcriptional regulator with XRE-family HTH domain
MELNNFHNRLESLIKERGVKKKDLAAAVDLSAGMITDMTKGRGKPSLRTISALSEYFNVSEEWLAYGAGEKQPHYEVTKIYEPQANRPHMSEALRRLNEEGDEELAEMVLKLLNMKKG